jgi:hypothetical protein
LAGVIEPPPVRYVQNEDVHIAYQVVGKGERDLVLVQGYLSHLDMDWGHPTMARFLVYLDTSGTHSVNWGEIAAIVEDAYRHVAPKTLVSDLDDRSR